MPRYSGEEPAAAAVAAALAPLAWRDLTERMLARCVVGAADRHAVEVLLRGVLGAAVGDRSPIEPADPGDDRVDALVAELGG